MQGKSVLVDTG